MKNFSYSSFADDVDREELLLPQPYLENSIFGLVVGYLPQPEVPLWTSSEASSGQLPLAAENKKMRYYLLFFSSLEVVYH